MVKNKIGGNRAKKGARKNSNNGSMVSRKLRMIEDEDEMYGIVTKMIGNGQVNVLCHDGKERLGFIRYKFSGRNKHSNLITCGCWVIVGCRSWETTLHGKSEKADLLEIYNHQEKTRLIQESKTNLSVLLKHEQHQIMGNDGEETSNDVGIVFRYDQDEDKIENMNNKTHIDNENIDNLYGINFDEI